MTQPVYDVDLTTSSDAAADALRLAVAESLEHRLSAMDRVKEALEADPDCVMGLCMRAGMMLQIGSSQVHPKITETLTQAETHAAGATRRERMHVQALKHWLAGNLSRAGGVWQDVIDECPSDILALRLHHNSSFWTGNRDGLRKAPLQVFEQIGENVPASGFVMGMCSFGLEESKEYEEAESFGRKAVERNEDDIWALHAVAHVLEMQCRHDEGRKLLNQPFGTWFDRNPFKDHLWWHSALFSLESGDIDRVLKLYDREVRVDEKGFYLDVQNAASLLKRLELVGVDVGVRWDELADLAQSRFGDHVMPFTDAHFMLALIGAGRLDAARDYLASLRNFAGATDNQVADVTRKINIPLCEALLAYGERDYGDAADGLYTMRDDLYPMGASYAQHDIFRQITIDAVMRAGQAARARKLLEQRVAARPGSDWARKRLEQLPR
jgi:tetratricopeptide (TPR) repeat protein